MNKEKVKLIIRNIDFLLDSLKKEIYFEEKINSEEEMNAVNDLIEDYDEILEEYE